MSTGLVSELSGINREVRDAMCRIRGAVPRSQFEAGVLGFLDELCRERGVKHPLAKYPEVAVAAAPFAPWSIVRGPLAAVEGHVFEGFYAASLPCLWESVSREKQANSEEDHATHHALHRPNERERLERLRDTLDVQIAESQLKRAVVVRRIREESR